MTPDRIAELRALCEGATEGPWKVCPDEDDLPLICCGQGDKHAGPIASLVLTDADAAFIAAGRSALPEALDRIEGLEEQRTQLINHWQTSMEQRDEALAEVERLRQGLRSVRDGLMGMQLCRGEFGATLEAVDDLDELLEARSDD